MRWRGQIYNEMREYRSALHGATLWLRSDSLIILQSPPPINSHIHSTVSDMKPVRTILFSMAILVVVSTSSSRVWSGPPHAVPVADPEAVVFCQEIDDNWNPVKPVTTIKSGEGVNFLVKLTEGIAVTAVVWDIYRVGADGRDEEPFNNVMMSSSDPDQKFRYWGTTEKTYFSNPGTYRVYMYPKNMNSDNFKSGNWEHYSAVGVIVVE